MSAVAAQSLFIRADAGGAIGTGHVMRMLALAQGWNDPGGWRIHLRQGYGGQLVDGECAETRTQAVFICAKLPEALEGRFRAEGFAVVRIDAEPGSEEDLRQTLAVVRGQVSGDRCQEPGDSGQEAGVRGQEAGDRRQEAGGRRQTHIPYPNKQWLVLDGYHFNYAYQKAVKAAGVFLLCVDDHGYAERWCCDAILNQNLDAETRFRYDSDVPDAKYLLGSSYSLLRREFWRALAERKPWQRIERLLLTLGGSDPENATGATLQLLDSACDRPLTVRVLAGVDNPHLAQLQSLKSHHSIEVLTKVTDMPAQYAWADGIISAGGSTCWEWLHAGLPGAIVTIAENQLPIVQALTETRRAALPLGWFQKFAPDVQGPLLAAWLETPELVTDQDAARSLIDGYGAHRVAGFVRGSRFTLRRAQASDCDLYFAWANDAEVRRNSFSPSVIPYEDHVKWFSKRLEDPNSRLLVGVDFNGNPVGQVRFDFEEQRITWIVHISVAPNCRGKGVGKNLIAEGLNWLRVYCGNNVLVEADVLDSNTGSMRLFENNGFKIKRAEDGFVSYCKTI